MNWRTVAPVPSQASIARPPPSLRDGDTSGAPNLVIGQKAPNVLTYACSPGGNAAVWGAVADQTGKSMDGAQLSLGSTVC